MARTPAEIKKDTENAVRQYALKERNDVIKKIDAFNANVKDGKLYGGQLAKLAEATTRITLDFTDAQAYEALKQLAATCDEQMKIFNNNSKRVLAGQYLRSLAFNLRCLENNMSGVSSRFFQIENAQKPAKVDTDTFYNGTPSDGSQGSQGSQEKDSTTRIPLKKTDSKGNVADQAGLTFHYKAQTSASAVTKQDSADKKTAYEERENRTPDKRVTTSHVVRKRKRD